MIHRFRGEAAAGAPESEVCGNGVQGKAAASDGQGPEINRVLIRIGLGCGRIGGGDRQKILRSELVRDERVVVERLAEAIELRVAEDVGGVQPKLIFLPIAQAVIVRIHVVDGDAKKFGRGSRGSLERNG